MKNTQNVERQVIELIATDRIDIPISSMSGKLKRAKPKLGAAIELPGNAYQGDRVYARVETEDKMKARGMKDAVAMFSEKYPRYGDILQGMIAEERVKRETHLYFGMHEGCRLTSDDYMQVMTDLGFSQGMAANLYPELMNVSRNLSRKRDEERSVMIG